MIGRLTQLSRARRGLALASTALIAVAVLPATQSGAADEPVPGMAGIDVSLPLTDSAVTINGRGTFADMEFTINQTENLTNQAVSVTWSGGEPTGSVGLRTFNSDFVQIMQCWGEPDAAVPENPGPPPEKCVWGSLNPTAASSVDGFATHLVTSRAFANRDFPDFEQSVGTIDAESGDVYRDFIAVDGTVVTDHVDATATGAFQSYWLNQYFDSRKTNEVPGVRTLSDGNGQALFRVDTGVESTGLGCGQRVEPTASGGPKVPRCWLVIVPRGSPDEENVGIPFPASTGVASSPMSPDRWANRVAVELDFTPVDSPCDLSDDQRRINGTELVLNAVVSWQPVLCTQRGRLPYAYGVVSDGLARSQIVNAGPGAPGMVAMHRPHAAGTSTPDDPIIYAPLATSAVSIGFNVERVGVLGGTRDRRLQGVRYAEMNLTPRLVAKLLTQSYRSQLEIRGSEPYEWDDDNPSNMFLDPDFRQFNPEFELWGTGSTKHSGGLVLPAPNSDLALQLWEWILADPEAKAWLDGAADEWGMVVNPVYATTAGANSNGAAFGTPVPEQFPKSDPYCFQAPPLVNNPAVVPPALCGLDWFPYASGLGDAAFRTGVTDDGSKTAFNGFAGDARDVWKSSGPQTLGRRTMLGLTDLVSVNRFGLQAARLSRAGDGGVDREFVAPNDESLGRAVASMTEEEGMLQLDPTAVDPGGYPLTTVAYAAIKPLDLDEAARDDFAAFLDYAAGPGQVPGSDLGQLPAGYLPLSEELAAQTKAAADAVRTLQAPPPPAAPPTDPSGVPLAQSAFLPSELSSFDGTSSGITSSDAADAVTEPTEPGGSTEPEAETPSSSGLMTPVASLGAGRFAVVAAGFVALLAALGFLEITKGRPRRRSAAVLPAGPTAPTHE